jgi:hypothetical protein
VINILSIDMKDSEVIGRLVDLVRHHCDADQCVDFFFALYRWGIVRTLPDEHPRRVKAWKEIEEWQLFIVRLPAPTRRIA